MAWFSKFIPYSDPEIEDDDGKEESSPFIGQESFENHSGQSFGPALPWIITTIILMILSSYLYLTQRNSFQNMPSYETGFSTDFATIKSQLQLQQVRFTGGIKFDENGTLFRSIDPTTPQYVGPPNSHIDEAWDTMLEVRYFAVTPDEAAKIGNGIYNHPQDGYITGVDVLHSLHCLNALRKALDADYYGAELRDSETRIHNDHCIDYLRQTLQCSADITPAPVMYYPSADTRISNFEQVHTCRNFERLLEWVSEKGTEVGEALKHAEHGH